MRVMARNDTAILPTSRGSIPTAISAKRAIRLDVASRAPKSSLYSDQPTSPSSVESFTNEKLRQPPSAVSVSILVMRMLTPRAMSQGDDVGERVTPHEAFQVVLCDRSHALCPQRAAGAGHVRRQNEVRRAPQWMIFGQRFGIGDIDRRSCDHAFDQRIGERQAVNDRPPRDVDQECAA